MSVLGTRQNLSKQEAEKIVNRFIEAREKVLTKAEEIENAVRRKLEESKEAAIHQAELVRRSALTAAWWLFATGLFSGFASAIGGVLALTA